MLRQIELEIENEIDNTGSEIWKINGGTRNSDAIIDYLTSEIRKEKLIKEINLKDMDVIDNETAKFLYLISSSYKQLSEVRGMYRMERYREQFGISEYHFINDELFKIVFTGKYKATVFVK